MRVVKNNYGRGMGALKPWQLVVFTLFCLLPVAAVIVGVWSARRRRTRVK